jgi:hypothetical protein
MSAQQVHAVQICCDGNERWKAGISPELVSGLPEIGVHWTAGLFAVAAIRVSEIPKDALEGLKLSQFTRCLCIGDSRYSGPAASGACTAPACFLLKDQASVQHSFDDTIGQTIRIRHWARRWLLGREFRHWHPG